MILALIGDTWQQSKQQGVFIFMLAMMALLLLVSIALPKTFVSPNDEKQFGLVIINSPISYFSQKWVDVYSESLNLGNNSEDLDASRFSMEEYVERRREQRLQNRQQRQLAVERASDLSNYQRAVEYYIYLVMGVMFTLTMFLFIAACSGYFPALLSSGAVDIVLSKPISRFKIYIAKYIGGVALYSFAILVFSAFLFVGIGMRTGIWHARIFYCAPLMIFTAMVLYGILSLIGTVTKSSTMAVLLGFVLYAVIDSSIALLLSYQDVFASFGWEKVNAICSVLRNVLPNFDILKDQAVASVLNVPAFQVQPFVVSFVWLVASVGLGYLVFSKRDF